MKSLRRPFLAMTGLACSVTLLASCSGLFGPEEAQRDEDGSINQSSDADVFSLKVGDCMDSGETDGEVSSVKAIPCSDEHDAEIYAEYSVEGDEFPGADELAEQADEFCYTEYEPFVGLAYEDSAHDYFPFTPTEDSWKQMDDRVVQCVIVSQEPVTSTLKGSEAGGAVAPEDEETAA